MKSTPTPHIATGVTTEEMVVKFGATGCMQYQVTVPAGTQCKKLDGGSNPWVVHDLGFITDKRSILYSDADIYGIRIPENKITDIKEVRRV